MKKFFVGVLTLLTVAASAQTADEIVQKYASAMGGLDAFKKVQSAKITGTVAIQGNDFPVTVQILNSRAFRLDVDVMGQSVVNSVKDGKGWKLNPFGGFETPTDVEGTELIDLKSQANLCGSLMDYKAQGHTIALEGQEDVGGVKTFKIKLTAKEDGRVSYYYISSNDFTLIKSSGKREMQGAEVEMETYLSNLKEIGGIKFAMSKEQKMNGQVVQSIVYNNIELNVKIDEKSFDK